MCDLKGAERNANCGFCHVQMPLSKRAKDYSDVRNPGDNVQTTGSLSPVVDEGELGTGERKRTTVCCGSTTSGVGTGLRSRPHSVDGGSVTEEGNAQASPLS